VIQQREELHHPAVQGFQRLTTHYPAEGNATAGLAADDAQACQLVDSGDYPIGIAKADERLFNVQMIYPSEGSGWEIMVGALVRKDPVMRK